MIQDVETGRAERKDVLLQTTSELGYAVAPELIDAAFVLVAERFDAAWKSGKQFVLPDGVRVVGEVLDTDPAHDADLVAAWMRWGKARDLQLVEPDLGETLAALSARRIGMGIICDVGLMPSAILLGHLERHGIRQYFDHCSFSDDVGFYKPAPEIFAHSHAGLGISDPSTALHIGDLRRTDVGGARSFGSVSARYNGVVDDTANDLPEADHVITRHRDLLDLRNG